MGPSRGDRAFILGPAVTHHGCHRTYIVSSCSERTSFTLAHSPLPLFHFAESDFYPPTPPHSVPPPLSMARTCSGGSLTTPTSVYAVSSRWGHRLAPGEGNLDPTGPQLQAGWIPTLRYTSLGGWATHTSSVTEVAESVQTLAPDLSPPTPEVPPPTSTPPRPIPSPLPQRYRSRRLQSLLTSVSAPTTALPVYSHSQASLNLDGAGKPLSFSSASRGPHAKEEWTLAN